MRHYASVVYATFNTNQCHCQCQSKIFSMAKIAELLRSPQRRSRITIQITEELQTISFDKALTEIQQEFIPLTSNYGFVNY